VPFTPNYFENLGIHLQRTIATEDTLADGIRDELSLRRIDPASDHIALISEWDTLYGQTLPQAVVREFAPNDPATSIHKFTYLRGLDGCLRAQARRTRSKRNPQLREQKRAARQIFSRSKPILRALSVRLERANTIISGESAPNSTKSTTNSGNNRMKKDRKRK
jgi:hypothetical protein